MADAPMSIFRLYSRVVSPPVVHSISLSTAAAILSWCKGKWGRPWDGRFKYYNGRSPSLIVLLIGCLWQFSGSSLIIAKMFMEAEAQKTVSAQVLQKTALTLCRWREIFVSQAS